ncbi:hypothetical protein CN895_07655 [Bacillus cereus]|uniref:hypothetical protein n=1 Tax=Bacillus cereus TaxID=1396 RepID=UPI000BFB26F2|nr:hypothetical protein [Bacillus cereus]PGK15216.1 hypothetical protein CN895_07655 [Bacillus cereus]
MNCIAPCIVNQDTEKAVQVRIDDDLFWFPKSQVLVQQRKLENYTEQRIILPYWLAEEQGLLAKNHAGYSLYPIQQTDIKI